MRGYQYYRKYWQPQVQQNLVYSHEKDNPYDFFQKQPPEVFYEKRCFKKFRKIHEKTPVPESLF